MPQLMSETAASCATVHSPQSLKEDCTRIQLLLRNRTLSLGPVGLIDLCCGVDPATGVIPFRTPVPTEVSVTVSETAAATDFAAGSELQKRRMAAEAEELVSRCRQCQNLSLKLGVHTTVIKFLKCVVPQISPYIVNEPSTHAESGAKRVLEVSTMIQLLIANTALITH